MGASQEQRYLDEVRANKDNPSATMSALHQLVDEVDTIHLSLARIAGVFDALDLDAKTVDRVSDAMAPLRTAIRVEHHAQKGKYHAQLQAQPSRQPSRQRKPAWLYGD